MVQVSPELNSREDATRGTPGDCFADLTLNPWSDAMEIDDGIPDQQTVGRRHEGKSSRHHPRDEGSDSESEARYETPRGEPGPGPVSVLTWLRRTLTLCWKWIQSKVRIKEVDYSSEVREHLRKSESALAEAVRQNQELAVRLSKATHSPSLTLHIGNE